MEYTETLFDTSAQAKHMGQTFTIIYSNRGQKYTSGQKYVYFFKRILVQYGEDERRFLILLAKPIIRDKHLLLYIQNRTIKID